MQKILAFNPIPHALLKQSERDRDHDEDTNHEQEPHIKQTYCTLTCTHALTLQDYAQIKEKWDMQDQKANANSRSLLL